MTRAGLEQTCCCVGDTKGSLWEVSTEGACAGEGCDHEGVGEWALSNHHWGSKCSCSGPALPAAPQLSGVSQGGVHGGWGSGARRAAEKPSQTSFQTPLPPF